MKVQDLCCLHQCANGLWFQVEKVGELIEKGKITKESLEIAVADKMWRYNKPGEVTGGWRKIGEPYTTEQFVQLVFDSTDFTQLKSAFSLASHYFSNKTNRGE